MVAVAATAGFIGAVVAVAGLAVVGVLRPRVVEKVDGPDAPVVQASSTASALAELVPGGLADLARDARRSVLRVEVTTADGDRSGSAVVHDADGILLTSAALVEGAMAVSVVPTDGRTRLARIVGIDAVTGLAALEVDARGLVPMSVGAPAEAGDPAVLLAATADIGGQPSVSVGVVSATGVSALGSRGPIRDLVQLDDPLPAAADGGLVVDTDGRLIGVALDLTTGDAADANGHVVPAETAGVVAGDLVEHGRVRRAWLGAEGTDLPSDQAAALDLAGGVVVERVVDGSPAATAGLVPGDVIVAVDGRAVRNLDELVVAVHRCTIGADVEVTYRREGGEVRTPVLMAEGLG